MIKFTTTILKFDKKGEKSGWTYIEIRSDIANKIKPANKKSFRVKGKLDSLAITQTSLLPMGNGSFILPINAEIRKKLGKRKGDVLQVQMVEDKSEFILNTDFVACLKDEPKAGEFFNSLTGSHQRYFSKWIDSAKSDVTKAKRIAMSINALARGNGYPEMIRENSRKNKY